MATFLDLTNRVLRRLNEVELSSSDFSAARGIQAAAKDAVNASMLDLNRQQFEWPQNAAEETTSLVVGQTEYSNPATLKAMEWNSFQIVGEGTYSDTSSSLTFIDRDIWYSQYRNKDDDNSTSGIGIPKYVFPSHGTGFGVSPAPDKTYRLQFRYFVTPTELLNHGDQITGNIVYPDAFTPVVVEGAMYHMYMLKDNPEAAQLSQVNFRQGIGDLKSQYINKFSSVRDTRVAFGGGSGGSRYVQVAGNF